MRPIRASLLPLVLFALGADAASRGAPAPAAEVVAAERAFAARAQQVDARDAFVEWFAPDAIAFGQGPGPAFPGLREGPPWGVNIQWRPVDAGIARSAEFGWTTGPAEYRKTKADATPYKWGFYTSVWMKQPDGRWRVAADIGANVPQPTMAQPDWSGDGDRRDRHDEWRPQRHGPTLEQRAQDLLAADRKLAARAADDAPQAFDQALLRDARYHRDGIPPAVGKNAALGALRDGATTYSWAPVGARVAASGELGFSYGSGEKRTTTGALPFHYLAIWEKHDGRWKLRVLVHDMVPPKPKAG
jgi:ketosteroid isomerase-like protein